MDEMNPAVEIVKEAGKILQKGWVKKDLAVRYKGEINPVTEIDREAEAFVTERLKKAFPGYGILSEESSERKGTAGARWILDPLDGTTNYIKRYPFVAVSLALEKDGELILGIVYNPILRELFTAAKGEGAFRNGEPIRVSGTSKLKSAVLCSGFPYDAWENPDNNSAQWADLLRRCLSLRCDGSAALDLCRVASGQMDGYWEKGLSPWDVAAGIVLVREAGGCVTDYENGAGFFSRSEMIATNGLLHQSIVRSVRCGAPPLPGPAARP